MHRVGLVVGAILMAVVASAQTSVSAQPPSQTNAAQAAPATPSQPADPAQQMQLDLDRMESLVNNMAAQVSFVRDTNMSILLNTNVQLWSVLIRDLRLQMQQQQRGSRPNTSPQR